MNGYKCLPLKVKCAVYHAFMSLSVVLVKIFTGQLDRFDQNSMRVTNMFKESTLFKMATTAEQQYLTQK